ncbi:hypothetical protein BO82DRAFT_397819 [Aspergillus uvarum CBS 121591]|uniref:NACHT domain-containing protein n=1 Tax=Aspergillus uvarum CBS 121591 TaxID=1448315 RepID=A0A319DDB9_9EURO|nr:hypothetical protein BO82DRAFT_397819 [Aspergillus uvarum CBS 121591]PYH86068.1 hypothetical protein BO82DRAFT_397819 [Aspergillus uvarum CBS 121591]
MSSSSLPSLQELQEMEVLRKVTRGGLLRTRILGLVPVYNIRTRLCREVPASDKELCLLEANNPALMSLEHLQALEPTRKSLASWLKYSDIGFFHMSSKPKSGKTYMVNHIARERTTPYEWNLRGTLRVIIFCLISDKQELTPRLFPRQYDSYPRDFNEEPCVIKDDEVLLACDRLAKLDSIYTDDKFVLYLDGLNYFKQDFSNMLSHLKQWVSARPLDVKICISSRGEAEFRTA